MVQPEGAFIVEMTPEFREAIKQELMERNAVIPTPLASQVRLLEEQAVRMALKLGEILATLRLPQNRERMSDPNVRVALWTMVDRWYEQVRPWLPKPELEPAPAEQIEPWPRC